LCCKEGYSERWATYRVAVSYTLECAKACIIAIVFGDFLYRQ
jgi:hypothetical protein